MTTLVAGIVATVLAVGTVVGVVSAVNDNSTDRNPASTAPVYGSR